MVFAIRLKELREERNLSQAQLAKTIGYSDSIISKWEKNQREPTASAIIALAKFFDVTTDYLLGLED